jgi:hypothetical protein
VFFGWTLVRALHGQGITQFSLPIVSLLAFVIAADSPQGGVCVSHMDPIDST